MQAIDQACNLLGQLHSLHGEALETRVVLEVLRARERIRGAHHWN